MPAHHAVAPALPGPVAPGPSVGTAHAKAILIGEHAVVHGTGAIVMPLAELPIRAELTEHAGGATIASGPFTGPVREAPAELGPTLTALRVACERFGLDQDRLALSIRSSIPFGRGLGSSAAVAAAVVGAVEAAAGIEADAAIRHELVQIAERVAHGRPSGIDAHGVLADQPLWFRRGEATVLPVGHLPLVLADTGRPSATRTAVTAVRQRREANPTAVGATLDQLGLLAEESREALLAGELAPIGTRMDTAHDLLATLGVSTPRLDELVARARRAGALGAKLTGSGGGGCVIALAPDAEAAAEIAAQLDAAGAHQTWTIGGQA